MKLIIEVLHGLCWKSDEKKINQIWPLYNAWELFLWTVFGAKNHAFQYFDRWCTGATCTLTCVDSIVPAHNQAHTNHCWWLTQIPWAAERNCILPLNIDTRINLIDIIFYILKRYLRIIELKPILPIECIHN